MDFTPSLLLSVQYAIWCTTAAIYSVPNAVAVRLLLGVAHEERITDPFSAHKDVLYAPFSILLLTLWRMLH